MPDHTLRPTEAPVSAPYAYTVAAPDGFTPKAVFASWDGSGAGGDFLPCVSYYSRDGVLVDRAFPTTGPVTAGGSADVGYRPFERGGGGGSSAPLAFTDGALTVSPVTEVFVDGNMVLTDLGAGEVQIRSTGGGTFVPPPELLCLFDVFSPADGLFGTSFPVVSAVHTNPRVVVVGTRARFQFGNFAQRLTLGGEVLNPTVQTLDCTLEIDSSIGPSVPGFPVSTTALAVPPGGTATLPPIFRDILPQANANLWLDFGSKITGSGVPFNGAQLVGQISFRLT